MNILSCFEAKKILIEATVTEANLNRNENGMAICLWNVVESSAAPLVLIHLPSGFCRFFCECSNRAMDLWWLQSVNQPRNLVGYQFADLQPGESWIHHVVLSLLRCKASAGQESQ